MSDRNVGAHEEDATETKARQGSEKRGYTKRETLRRIGVSGAVVAGISGTGITSISARFGYQSVDDCEEGYPSTGGSDTSMHFVVVDGVQSAGRNFSLGDWSGKARETYEGVCAGLSELYSNNSWWFDGYIAELVDPGAVYDGPNNRDGLLDFLADHGLTDDVHYLVVFPGDTLAGSISNYSNWNLWGDDNRRATGLAMESTRAVGSPAGVRGLHQLLHGYIGDGVAHRVGNLSSSLSNYDAQHNLGTVHDSGVRTIMADTYPGAAGTGACSSGAWFHGPPGSYERIYFSNCTENALRQSSGYTPLIGL